MNTVPAITAAFLRAGAHLVSSGGGRALLILTYHRVLPGPDALLPDQPEALEFAAHLDLLKSVFHVLPLAEACERMKKRSLPPRAVSITFDDGYANNLQVAAPLLRARNLPATVFVAPGFLDGGRMFNDTVIEVLRRAPASFDMTDLGLGVLQLPSDAARRAAIDGVLGALKYRPLRERQRAVDAMAERIGVELPGNLMMTSAEVRDLARFGIAVGAHTINHPILTQVDAATAEREIGESRTRLEAIVGERVDAFAYPNGRPGRDYDATHVAMVRAAGYRCAVTTAWGRADADCDPLQLPRIAPWDRSALGFALRMLRACVQRGEQVRPAAAAVAA
jgi:peptidoglycan/xylan/chitin deacetylase (PgdA/CDA1 family)